ncbi:hypothetical protein STCU_00592 [Strigomonas culicis]|uniref:Uncharacterized protein n=1 Tax=Strigomonas culicis TaxID=28005 RepID=S9WKC3_9TRYP|nr:hypothetical protein STCU_00592 [Strigomonas culicis]|eukprot:EPY36425.1 hypothetical protein STCU_00592 [Strigomonas culicis]
MHMNGTAAPCVTMGLFSPVPSSSFFTVFVVPHPLRCLLLLTDTCVTYGDGSRIAGTARAAANAPQRGGGGRRGKAQEAAAGHGVHARRYRGFREGGEGAEAAVRIGGRARRAFGDGEVHLECDKGYHRWRRLSVCLTCLCASGRQHS